MRYLFTFALCLSQLLLATPSALKEFPATSNEVLEFTQDKLMSFQERFSSFIEKNHDMTSFTEVISGWNDTIYPLFQTGILLQSLPLITTEQKTITTAIEQCLFVQKKAQTAMETPEVFSLMVSFAQNPQKQKNLTPYERYCLLQILQTIPDSDEIKLAKTTLSSYPMQPFLYAKGDLTEKTLPKDRTLTCMSWNVCLFDANLSMLFGGVLPWQARITQIADKILELHPDILCLQEVFSPNANLVLVEKLRGQYAHFYYKIGPNPVGFSINSLRIPSGLFIASKFPLQAEQFTSYAGEETPSYRGYGFFSANIYSKNEKIGHFVTTHLQPGYEKVDKNFRKKQLLAITNSLPKNVPIFLCGDLNIVEGSEEAKKNFASYPKTPYEGLNWTCCELRDYWWKAKQNVKSFINLNPEKEWLDYFFLISPGNSLSCKTKVLCANDLESPETALSDHQILLSTLKFSTK